MRSHTSAAGLVTPDLEQRLAMNPILKFILHALPELETHHLCSPLTGSTSFDAPRGDLALGNHSWHSYSNSE